MSGTKQTFAEYSAGSSAGVGALLQDRIESLFPQPLQLFPGEAWVKRHIRHDLQRLSQVTLERIERHHAPLTTSAGGQVTS